MAFYQERWEQLAFDLRLAEKEIRSTRFRAA